MPAVPPAPIAAASETTVAVMPASLVAVSATPAALVTMLSSMWALAVESTLFIATAPAPLIASPRLPPKAAEKAAPIEATSIVGALTWKRLLAASHVIRYARCQTGVVAHCAGGIVSETFHTRPGRTTSSFQPLCSAYWPVNRAKSCVRIGASPAASIVPSLVPEVVVSSRSATAASSRPAVVTSPPGVKVNSGRPSASASALTPPVVVVMPWSAPVAAASTWLETSLNAIESASATEMALLGASDTAIEAAPASAWMPEPSVARRATDAAVMPAAPSPVITARVSAAIRFSA